MDQKHEKMINKYHHKFLERRLSELNIGRAEAPYIKMIYHESPIKMNQLIANVVFHKSHTTRAINQMVKDGLITKEKDPLDKRSYIITITEKGIEVAESVKRILKDWDELINSALSIEEQEQLKIMREKVFKKLTSYFEEEDNHEAHV